MVNDKSKIQGEAMPRRWREKIETGLRPWYGLWPINLGHSPNQGHSPALFLGASGGAEPRLTSGGEAAASLQHVSNPAAKPQYPLHQCLYTIGSRPLALNHWLDSRMARAYRFSRYVCHVRGLHVLSLYLLLLLLQRDREAVCRKERIS
jgi:hypothetical protein